MNEGPMSEKELAPGDINAVVEALLESIGRGELDASPKEIEFLRSVSNLLRSTTPSRPRSTASV